MTDRIQGARDRATLAKAMKRGKSPGQVKGGAQAAARYLRKKFTITTDPVSGETKIIYRKIEKKSSGKWGPGPELSKTVRTYPEIQAIMDEVVGNFQEYAKPRVMRQGPARAEIIRQGPARAGISKILALGMLSPAFRLNGPKTCQHKFQQEFDKTLSEAKDNYRLMKLDYAQEKGMILFLNWILTE